MSSDSVIDSSKLSSENLCNGNEQEISNENVQSHEENEKAEASKENQTTSQTESDSTDSYDTDSDIEFPVDFNFDLLDEQMRAGVDLRPFLSRVLPGLPEDVSQSTVYGILMELFLPFRRREVLEQYQTLDDAVNLIHKCKNILVLTGAGVSVSCGIPDFRSRNGIYSRLSEEFPELPDPQAMFDIEYFTNNPRPFFRFAKEIWPGQYEPSLSHFFIAQLEHSDKLLRNYTQNIDSLEHLSLITRLIQCHGSFSTSTCRICKSTVQSDEIKEEILQQRIPRCSKCPDDVQDAILKPDIVFFGESLSNDFHQTISVDKEKCDLLIVMGSSLKVKPVSLVSELLPENVPQILINRERLPHKTFDIELLGNCDTIINELCNRLSKLDSSFGGVKHLKSSHQLQEVLYESLEPSFQQQKRKKQKLSQNSSPSNKEATDTRSISSSRSSSPGSARRSFSSLITSTSFNVDSSYIYYPPRRYIFAGAEIDFSSDEESSTDEDEDLPRKKQ